MDAAIKEGAKPPVRVAWPHIVTGAIGIGVSLYSVYLHNVVKHGGSACGISETINCDVKMQHSSLRYHPGWKKRQERLGGFFRL